jgi:hypothetical protein
VGEAEGEDFGEGFEEDQGLASQGKPFILTPCYLCSWLQSFYPWSLDLLRSLGLFNLILLHTCYQVCNVPSRYFAYLL